MNLELGGMLQCFKLVSTGLGEWLKRIFMSSGNCQISNLFPRHVRPEIVLEDVLYGLVRGRNHHVGRCEPDATLKPVNVKNLRGVIERVVQSVNGQLRALVNKLG